MKGSLLSCFNCGYKFDGHTCITDEKATLGESDISICLNCGEVHQYKNGGLEVIDIRDLPKETQEGILKINVVRQMVMQRNGIVKK